MIYFTDVTAFHPEDHKWDNILSPARKQRILSLKQPEDRQRSLVAELLFCFAVRNERLGIALPVDYSYDAKGKPIDQNNSIRFSLSHSGRYAACAISVDPIGIDIQWHKEADVKVIEKCLTKNQIDMIKVMPPKKQLETYFDFWCLKESLFKVTGEGSIRQPVEFEFSNLGGRLGISKGTLNLQNFSTVPGYSLGVCVDGPIPHCIFQVSAKKIEDMLLNQ